MAAVKPFTKRAPITGTPWKGVRYGCTTREGGVSQGPWTSFNLATHVGDEPEAVAENRRLLATALPSAPVWLNQVHGTRVVEVSAASHHGPVPEADAAVTTTPEVVLAIMTADCIPVVLADVDGRALGVAHAGWRGLAAGVLEQTLDALRRLCPESHAWRAWVGPCIGQANFEVGGEVRQAFAATDARAGDFFLPGRASGKWHADLSGLARHRLACAGVEIIQVAELCTYECDKLFHSYRRNRVCGRMATLAWLDPSEQG